MDKREVFDRDAESAEKVKCPVHGRTCRYHASMEGGTYHAYAICRKCGWMKEF